MIADYANDSLFQTISLCTGDLVTYGAVESRWQNEFFTEDGPSIRQRLSEVAFVSCLGNHELYKNNYSGIDLSSALFGKYFPSPYIDRRYWSFDYGPLHVVVVDQYPDFYSASGQGLISAEQMQWLEPDLNAANKPWKIAIMHEPGYSTGGSSSGYPHPNNDHVRDSLQPLFEQFGVQLVLCGHNHYYARACKNGIYHVTAAGGGAPLYSPDPWHSNVIKTEQCHHYCRAEISDTTMSVQVVKPNGDTIDEFLLFQNSLPSHLLGFINLDGDEGDVRDVVVTVDGQTLSPDSIGYYGISLDPGTYQVTFHLQGYEIVQEEVTIVEGTETQLDVSLIWTSILENRAVESGIICSPNPCLDEFILKFGQDHTVFGLDIKIYTITGQEVKNISIPKLINHDSDVVINVADLNPGLYFVTTTVNGNVFAAKLLKR
jgi:hypothetical protein